MTIPRSQIPYVTMKNVASSVQACYGSYAAAAEAVGYSSGQLRRWASRGILPRPVYDRLAAASPTPFPRFGRTKWVRAGRAFEGPDSVGELHEQVRPVRGLRGKSRKYKATTVVRPVESRPAAEVPDALMALQQLITALQQTQAENDQLKAKLTALREALV